MKRITAVFLITILTLCSLAACANDGIVGTWEGVSDGHTGTLVFKEDGTGSVSIDGVSVDVSWLVAEGKYLTVTVDMNGAAHKFFDGEEFSVDGDKLTIISGGTMAEFTRKK